MARYSLSKYTVTITTDDEAVNNLLIGSNTKVLTIGGNGSYTENITVSLANNLYNTSGYATGGYVHDKNLSRVGTVAISLSQLSAEVQKFINLCNHLIDPNNEEIELTITVYEAGKAPVAKCTGCVPSKIPDQSFGATATNQTWVFNAGIIEFTPKTK